jgi:hypothetical protein
MLTLSDARKTGKLKEFAEQELVRGVQNIFSATLNAAIVSTVPKQLDQTSDLPESDYSSGKKTR